MPPPNEFEFLLPWKNLADSSQDRVRAEKLTQRLKEQLPPHHALAQGGFQIVAERKDRDEVLLEISGGSKPLAEVHMTWRKETDHRFPRTKFFDSWQQWAQASMTPAHSDFTAGQE